LLDDDDVPATVQRFVRRAVATMPGCDYVAITVRPPDASPGSDAVEMVAGAGSANARSPHLDAAMPNPIAETMHHHESRRVDDSKEGGRWPAYRDHLLDRGYRCCLSLPMPSMQEPPAAFTLFSAQPAQFGEDSNDLALLFTMHAGVTFDNAALYHDSRTLIDHLHTALRTRTVISQAQGLLMRHNHCDTEQAFAVMKRASQHHNIKLRVLATALIDAHQTAGLTAVLDRYELTETQPQRPTLT
jgi:hypothetical protein